MHITLMRHGKPLLPKTGWLAPFEMAQWIADYNLCDVDAADIPAASLASALSASVILTSTASRALSSARALGLTGVSADAIFCEADLPFALWRFPSLPPHAWAIFFRLLWLFGYARGAGTLQATRHRAKVAASKLIGATQNGPVLLVGHAIMNRLIAKELVVAGWVRCTKHQSTYWSTSVYGLAR